MHFRAARALGDDGTLELVCLVFHTRSACENAPKAAQGLSDMAVYVYTAAASHVVVVVVVVVSLVLVVKNYDEFDGSSSSMKREERERRKEEMYSYIS